MIDLPQIAALATSAVTLLSPLLSKALDKSAEELGKSAATSVLSKLKSILSPAKAKEALEDLAQQPSDADAQAALRIQLRKAMETDPTLAEQVQSWLTESKQQVHAAGISLTANTQGDSNTVVQIAGSGNAVQL